MFGISRLARLTGGALRKRRQQSYRSVVIMLILIICIGQVADDAMKMLGLGAHLQIIYYAFLIFGGVYLYFIWDLLRALCNKQWIISAVAISMVIIYVAGLVVENPFSKIENHFRFYLAVIHFALLLIQVVVMIFAFKDIFSGGGVTTDKLWGSACVYLMMGITFASIYDIVNIIQPGSFGVMIELGYPNYAESVYYSLCSISGYSSVFTSPSHLVRNITMIEVLWGNLYLVLLIGRIIGMPKGE